MGLKITTFDVNGRKQPIGIDDRHLVFHFTAESEKNGAMIQAYQLVITNEAKEIMWHTGKTDYSGVNDIVYYGEILAPKSCYQAELSIWDEDGRKSECAYVLFETGFLGEKWEADWIEPVQEPAIEEKELGFLEMIIPSPEFWGGEARLRECRQLKREFDITGNVKKARIYASAHGVYQLYLNDKKVSERRLAPENSAYEKILYYQTYDVTEFLSSGENRLGVLLGDGWWIGRLGMAGDSCNYGNTLGFIMQLEIEYEDGTKQAIYSDEHFWGSACNIRYSDLYIGEKQDFTWQEENWQPCKCVSSAKDILVGQKLDGVQVNAKIPVQQILHTPKQELVLDFGQVLAGVCRLEINAAEGTVLTLEHGEVLDQDGNYINNILGRNKDQKDTLICREGRQIFEPQFTYHGFRYVRITGIEESQIISAKALVLGSPIEKQASFSCSNQDINQLQHNIEWSTIGNMFSVPTDCPQREKLGWTGDIQVFAKTGCFNYDLRSFLSAWLFNVRAEQGNNGEIPVVVPNAPKQERTQRIMSGGSNSSAVWGDACVLVPYYLFESYGDKTVLKENFDMMQKWLSYIKECCALKPEGYANFSEEQKKRNPYLWTKQYHFGDWLIPSLRALPNGVQKGTEETAAVVGSSYYAVTVSYFIKVCEALGKRQLGKEYKELLEKIKCAVREEFVAEDGTVNHSSLQGLYVIVLKAGIVEGKLKEKVLDKLVGLIEENGSCLDTGFASVSYLLDILYENGRADMAYRLLFQTKAPSWLYMVKNGATTIWENWLAVLENGTPTESSYNHYAFGCVGDFIYRHIGGIKSMAPGYQKILFAPDFSCGLKESTCELMTPYGKAALAWKLIGNEYQITGQVPVGVTAELSIDAKLLQLKSGAFQFSGNLSE